MKRFFLLAVVFGAVCVYASTGAQAVGASIEAAREQFRMELLIEAAGLFWIAAEVAILFCMTVAVRIFAPRPLPSRIALTQREKKRAVLWGLALGALAASVFGRHLFIAPLPEAFSTIVMAGTDVQARVEQAYNARTHIHIALWCSFIFAWVLLEIAIVVLGIRSYRHLRELTGNG